MMAFNFFVVFFSLQAFALFNEASELGNPFAWYNMGISYEMGLGTKKSYKKVILYQTHELFKNFIFCVIITLF